MNSPGTTVELMQRGLALHQAGQVAEALSIYRAILVIEPCNSEALHLAGVAALQLGDHHDAIGLIEQAVAADPASATAYCNLGSAWKSAGDLNSARVNYEKAISLEPGHAQAWHNRGVVLGMLGQRAEALASHERAVELDPAYLAAWFARAKLLRAAGRFAEELAVYEAWLAVNGDQVEAHLARGNVLRLLRRPGEAIAAFDRVLALQPGNQDAVANRGSALFDMGRNAEALASLDAAMRLGLDHPDLHWARAQALVHLKRFGEAIEAYERTLTLEPSSEFIPGNLLFTRLRICDWRGIDQAVARIEAEVEQGTRATPPFVALIFSSSPATHAQAARTYATARFPSSAERPALRSDGGKIRLGYFSADFHDHATAWLLIEVLEAHNRALFELYGFSFGPDQKDSMRRRLSSCMHRFIDARAMPDMDIARMSRDLGIDIAVDLKGYTQNARSGIFAARCAPIQVNFLGYPGTLGAGYFDYIVADKTVLPTEAVEHFDEMPVWLPNCYQPNDSQRPIAARAFSRKEAGLPDEGFVFACFNNNFKILPDTFDAWMRILRSVEGSVLWLLQDNPSASDNLRREARARGIDPDRLVFAPRLPLAEHLARHRLAGLFLDTFPYNAHTTASDALWAGLPLLTCLGDAFAGRVSASLLRTLGLEELIAPSLAEYEAMAIALAGDPARLDALKMRLNRAVRQSPLFDGKLYARHLEAAYLSMYERLRSGLEPVPIVVPA